jgi:phosphotransferase system IIA component
MILPVDGEIVSVFETKHVITILGENGLEIFIHMGLDTVTLQGGGFDVKVAPGVKVAKGDLLAVMDCNLLEEKGFHTVTPIIVLNGDLFAIHHSTVPNEVKQKDRLMDVISK